METPGTWVIRLTRPVVMVMWAVPPAIHRERCGDRSIAFQHGLRHNAAGQFWVQIHSAGWNLSADAEFAELYFKTSGSRVFNVIDETSATTLISNLDVVAASGNGDTAYDKTFTVTATGGSYGFYRQYGPEDHQRESVGEHGDR